jgi:hypothetical protein
MKNNSKIEPHKNEVSNKNEAIKKLNKDRLKIKEESESFARKIAVNSIKAR